MSERWTCPYCNRHCTIGDADIRSISNQKYISKEYGYNHACTTIIVCPNPECRKRTISLEICNYTDHNSTVGKTLYKWNLLPESDAKPFPDYIPQQLRNDYAEACLIKIKSPKASATLSRRCLQGVIRDFWGIKKGRLVDEVEALKEKVDSGTWDAIEAVRHVGNIGAHMEKDVNLVVDVEPDEAGMLTQLIETLFEDWYVARHDRQTRMSALAKMGTEKRLAKGTAPLK